MKRRSFFASLFGLGGATVLTEQEPQEIQYEWQQYSVDLGGEEVIDSDDPRLRKIIDDLNKVDPWQEPFDGKRKKEINLGAKVTE
jgi:hypothetical protein